MKYSSCGRNKTRVAPLIAAVCLLTSCAAFASRAGAMSEDDADGVAPGSYRWDPSVESDGGRMSMRVDLATQKAYVYRGSSLIGITTIASGKRGYETPDGSFTVLEKERFHNSSKYDNAPMPFMQRLSWSGLALHGGHPHGHPASHGCIRLPMGFAAALFKEDTHGMRVDITGHWGDGAGTMMASRPRRRSAHSDNLRATEFSSGRSELDDDPPPPCCDTDADAPPATRSTPAGNPDDQTDDAGDNRDWNPNSDHETNQRDREASPPDLPPPPPEPIPFTR